MLDVFTTVDVVLYITYLFTYDDAVAIDIISHSRAIII